MLGLRLTSVSPLVILPSIGDDVPIALTHHKQLQRCTTLLLVLLILVNTISPAIRASLLINQQTDANGNIVGFTNRNTNRTIYRYDYRNRPLVMTQPLGGLPPGFTTTWPEPSAWCSYGAD